VLEAVFVLALGIPPPANPELAKLLASEGLTPLARSGEVRVSRVDDFLPPERAVPVDAESLQFPGVFRVRRASRTLTPEDAALVRAILRRQSSYESYATACVFEPGVAFLFPSRSDLLVLVCFKCEEVAFAKGSKGLAKFSLSELGKQDLLKLSTKFFPELGKQGSRRGTER
jgi:hypothetical protein